MKPRTMLAAAIVAAFPHIADAKDAKKVSLPTIRNPHALTTCHIGVPGSEDGDMIDVPFPRSFVAQIQQAFNDKAKLQLPIDGNCDSDLMTEALTNDWEAGEWSGFQVLRYKHDIQAGEFSISIP